MRERKRGSFLLHSGWRHLTATLRTIAREKGLRLKG
jgi:hypothetical protein